MANCLVQHQTLFSDGDASLTIRKGATPSVREQEESPMGNRRVRSILVTESKTERSADDMNAAIGSQSKFRFLMLLNTSITLCA